MEKPYSPFLSQNMPLHRLYSTPHLLALQGCAHSTVLQRQPGSKEKGKGKNKKKKKKEDHRATLLCAKAHTGVAGAGDLPVQDLGALQLELRRRRDMRQAETRRCQAPC